MSLTAAGKRKVQPLLKQAKAHEAQVVTAFGEDQAHQLKLLQLAVLMTSCTSQLLTKMVYSQELLVQLLKSLHTFLKVQTHQ